MEKPTKRDALICFGCLSAGAAILFGSFWYMENKKNVGQMPSLTASNVAVALPAKPSQKNYTLKNQSSPFGSINQQNKSIPGRLPPLPSIPVKTTMPVPSLPSTLGKPSTDNETGRSGLHVTSVFIGSGGRNMAVLSDGKTQVTAREGKECKFGYVEEITKEGVSVGGRWLEVSKTAKDPENEPKTPIAPPAYAGPPVSPPQPTSPVQRDDEKEETSKTPKPVDKEPKPSK